MRHPIKNTMSISAVIFAGLLTITSAQAEEAYYRWVGDDGVVHYGSRPPQGVDAVRIKTKGFPSASDAEKSKKEVTEAQQDTEVQTQAAIAQRKQQCADEKSRLHTLKTSGARIRMKDPDGTIRYLTPQEIASEISAGEQFLKQACK